MIFKFDFEQIKERLPKRLILAVLLFFLLSVGVNTFRQFFVYKRINEKLSSKQETLRESEKINQELKAKLFEAKSPQYLENQARKILGLPPEGNTVEKEEIGDLLIKEKKNTPKYKEWLDLFLY